MDSSLEVFNLSNNKLWHSHGRSIDVVALTHILKLKIEDYSNDLALNQLLQKEVEKDLRDQLPPEIQDSIFEGINDIKSGKVFVHEQVMHEAKQKYGFLHFLFADKI